MNVPIARYQSYLLRLWQDSPQAPWHASAQCIQTSKIIHFADLELLYRFLADNTTPGMLADGADDVGIKQKQRDPKGQVSEQ